MKSAPPSIPRSWGAALARAGPWSATASLARASAPMGATPVLGGAERSSARGIASSAVLEKRYTNQTRERDRLWKAHRSKKAKKRYRRRLEKWLEANPPPPPAPVVAPAWTPADKEELERGHRLVFDVLRMERAPVPKPQEGT